MSFGMMVTRLAWMAARLVSSNRPTRYASDASWRARTALDWKRRSVLKSCAISRTRRWKGSFRIRSSVDFWYFRISLQAGEGGGRSSGGQLFQTAESGGGGRTERPEAGAEGAKAGGRTGGRLCPGGSGGAS